MSVFVREDSVIAGDSVTLDIILGDGITTIDSIYSMACIIQSDYLFNNSSERIIIPQSDLGDPMTNLYTYNFPHANQDLANILLCKTNHQNSSLLYDTIATIRIQTPQGQGNLSKYYKLIPIVNAITKEGFPVTLNAMVTDSIYYSDPFANISTLDANSISIFPNPAQIFITIESTLATTGIIEIYSVDGKLLTSNTIDRTVKINLDEFSNGFYYAKFHSALGEITKSFVISK